MDERYGKCERCKNLLIPRVVMVTIENITLSDQDTVKNYFLREYERLFRDRRNERLLCCSKCSYARRVDYGELV
jgi:hypothetical protein